MCERLLSDLYLVYRLYESNAKILSWTLFSFLNVMDKCFWDLFTNIFWLNCQVILSLRTPEGIKLNLNSFLKKLTKLNNLILK